MHGDLAHHRFDGPRRCKTRRHHLDFGTTAAQLWLQAKGKFRQVGTDLGLSFANGSASAIAWGDLDAMRRD